jgi:hypothetical protein
MRALAAILLALACGATWAASHDVVGAWESELDSAGRQDLLYIRADGVMQHVVRLNGKVSQQRCMIWQLAGSDGEPIIARYTEGEQKGVFAVSAFRGSSSRTSLLTGALFLHHRRDASWRLYNTIFLRTRPSAWARNMVGVQACPAKSARNRDRHE